MLATRIWMPVVTLLFSLIAAGCSNNVDSLPQAPAQTHTVTASAEVGAGAGGSITPPSVSVIDGASTVLAVVPNIGYRIGSVTPTGCAGTLTDSTYTTGPITADCAVVASFTRDSYTVTAMSGPDGGISPGSATVVYGATTTFTVTPSAGYTASVTGCGGTLAGNIYTTGPIVDNCAVVASFTLNSYTVTATTAGVGGGINPGSAAVAYGATMIFAVTPSAGYTANVTGCGGTLAGSIYTTGPIVGNCAVVASFTLNSYTVTATTSGVGGGISSGSATVAYGAKATFTVTPSAGYRASVTGCGGTLAGSIYTTGPIVGNCAVVASFTLNSYTVTATTSGVGGGISPGSATVAYGATTSFTVTPSAGYSIAGVTASGCSGTLSGATYTTGSITANCSVTASFAVVPSVLDQEQASASSLSPQGPRIGAALNQVLLQTFTAGLSGVLTDVAVYGHLQNTPPPGDIVLQVKDAGGTILASGSVAGNSFLADPFTDRWITVSFASPPTVSAGTQYTLVVTSTASSNCDPIIGPCVGIYYIATSAYDNQDVYLGGSFTTISSYGIPYPEPLVDMAFRTYVRN